MNPLERSYRRLLHAYPRQWREERGEEMLAVLLEWAPDDRIRPTAREALDVIGNGLGARIAAATGWIPRGVLARVGLLSLGSGAALAAYCLLFGEYVEPALREHTVLNLGPIYSAGSALYVGWLAAAILAVAGVLRNTRRVAALLLSLPTALGIVHVAAPGLATMPPLYLLALFAGLGGLSLLSPRRVTRSDRTLVGLSAVALGLGISAMSQGVPLNGGGGYMFYRNTIPNLADGAWLIAAAYWLVGAVASIRRPGWALATAVGSVPWICLALLFLTRNGPNPVPAMLFLGGILLTAMLFRDGFRANTVRPGWPGSA